MKYEKKIPLYIQVRDDIYNKIESNEFSLMLPSEKELMKIYNVSRVTLRGALLLLEQEGFITRKAGFGTTINRKHNELINFTSVNSFTNEMKDSGKKESKTLSSTISIVYANKEMIDVFNCSENKKLYNLKRLRGSNNKPVVYSDTWLNLDIDLPTSREFLFGSLYKYLVSKDILFSRFEEELEAIIPTKETKELLNLSKDSVILKRTRKGYDIDNNLIEYTINYYDSSLYKYKVIVEQIEKVK